MTKGEIHDLKLELKKYFIRATVKDYHVKLACGERQAREHYAALINSDEGIEAQLILELSKDDKELRYDIQERASIVWESCGKYDEIAAVKMNMEVARRNEGAR